MGKGWVDRIASAADRAFDEVKAVYKFIGGGDDEYGRIGASPVFIPKAAVQHDAALAATSEKDHDGWLDAFLSSASRVGGEKLNELLGPQGVTGTAIGGLPEGPRGGVGAGLTVASDVIEVTGREAIRRPLATLALISAASGQRDLGDLLSADELKALYNMTRTTSVGQALAINLGQVDPFDRAQVEEFRHSDFYRVASGATDATLRMIADVDVLTGEALSATKAARRVVDAKVVLADEAADVTPLLSHLDDVTAAAKERQVGTILSERAFDQPGLERIFASKQWQKVDKVMGEMEGTADQRTAKIADRFFHEDPDGATMAGFLARAKDPQEREQVMRVLHGDLKELQTLKETNVDLGIEMTDTMQRFLLVDDRAAVIRNFEKEVEALDPEIRGYLQRFADEANDIIDKARAGVSDEARDINLQMARNTILSDAAGTVIERPVVTMPGAIRTTIKSSEVWQTGPGRALQIFTNMVPNRLMDVSGGAPQSVTSIRRYAQDAQFDADTIDDFVGRYANAVTPLERKSLSEEMMDTALRKVAEENNIDLAQVEEIAQAAVKTRRATRDLLDTRAYDAHGRASVVFTAEDGTTVLRRMPLSVTQTADMVVLDDIKAIRNLFSYHGKKLREFPNAKQAVTIPSDALDGLMAVWRPAALMRPAWPIRFTLDEHMRYGAKYGALAEALALKSGVPDLLEAQGLSLGLRDSSKLLAKYTGKTVKRGDLTSIALVGAGAAVGGPVGAAVGAAVAAPIALMGRITGPDVQREFAPNGLKVLGAFGATADQEKLWRSQVSAGEDLDRLLRRNERGALIRLRKDRSRFEVKMPNDPDHLERWSHVLNNVIGQDQLLSRIAKENLTPAEVAAWLKTADGYEYASKIGFYSGTTRGPIDEWAQQAVEMVEDHIMAGTDQGAAIVARLTDPTRKVTTTFLNRVAPDVPTRPPSFGPLLEEHIVSQNSFVHAVRTTTDKVFEVLGTNTTDNLTRNPFFAHAYEDFMTRAIDQVGPELLTPSYIHNLEGRGRRYALAELNKYMYDLSERSQFAEMTRNLAVFFSANQEIVTRWAGLAVENPAFIARGIKVFNAPDKAGLTWTDPESGEEYLQFRIPEMFSPIVDSIPWLKGSLDSQQTMRISKRGLAGLSAAFPSGPFVALALSQVLANSPEAQANAAVEFIMPFGVEENPFVALAPNTIRRAAQAVGMDLDARERGTMQARILATRLVEMKSGAVPMIDMNDPGARAEFVKGVEDEAQKMLNLKFATGLFMISPLSFDSPYKPYVDYYRALQDVQRSDEELYKDDPDAWEKVRNADEIFLEEMGPEFFDLTTAMTKSMNGIPATASGQEFTEKWEPFLNTLEDPGLAGLVFGTDGGSSTDEYLASFKKRQERTPLRPGSAVNQREGLSLDEAVEAGDIRVGWLEYVKGADAIDAAREQRGLPNLKVKAAADLALRKKALTDNLTKLYPAWRDDFDQRDSGAWQRKIRDLWRIAENPDLAQRQSIAALGQYLTNREEVLKVMKAKGISDISSKAAVGVAKLWDSYVTTLTNDPAFSRTYHRWLENDPMNVESIRNG